jgi:hypothetical protein
MYIWIKVCPHKGTKIVIGLKREVMAGRLGILQEIFFGKKQIKPHILEEVSSGWIL